MKTHAYITHEYAHGEVWFGQVDISFDDGEDMVGVILEANTDTIVAKVFTHGSSDLVMKTYAWPDGCKGDVKAAFTVTAIKAAIWVRDSISRTIRS